MTSRLSSAATLIVLIAMWLVAHRLGALYGRLPAPTAVAEAMVSDWYASEVPKALLRTLTTAFLGVLLGGGLGFIGGLTIGLSRPYFDGLYYLANAIRTIPVTVLIPVFLAAFGLRGFILPLVVLPIATMMAANVADSIDTANRNRRRLLSLYEVETSGYVRHVLFFEILDGTLATLRIAIPLALALEVALDYFLNVNQGVGKLISEMYQAPGHEAQMYAAILTVGALGIAIVRVLDTLSRRALAWKRDM